MRLTAAEKREVIRLVEGSDLSVRRTLGELGVQRSTFYGWYRRYRAEGPTGLQPHPAAARRVWNRIPPRVRQRVVDAENARGQFRGGRSLFENNPIGPDLPDEVQNRMKSLTTDEVDGNGCREYPIAA